MNQYCSLERSGAEIRLQHANTQPEMKWELELKLGSEPVKNTVKWEFAWQLHACCHMSPPPSPTHTHTHTTKNTMYQILTLILIQVPISFQAVYL